MKKSVSLHLFFFFLFFLFSCTSVPVSQREKTSVNPVQKNAETLAFNEIWAYLLDGKEETLSVDMPISDVGYFGAEISNQGKLTGVPTASNIDFYTGRVHLVAVCNSYGMSHMVLNPEYPLRDKLITDLIHAVEQHGYDGLQIDYELVLASDKENFLSFLQELSEKLQGLPPTDKVEKRILSVAVPARTRHLSEDAYDYRKITAIADSVFVMAYDEHWSNGEPGPVASFDWGKKVASYALETIGVEKLVMGQPFYGRTWGNIKPNRAFFHSGMERQVEEFNVTNIERIDSVLHFTYEVPLTITAYYDDAISIHERSEMYKDMNINKTGFWCLGQEDPAVWEKLQIKE